MNVRVVEKCGLMMSNLRLVNQKKFKNGTVYALKTKDGLPIEVTDTFLPYYTKNAIQKGNNRLVDSDVATRSDRWMIGVSVMSGCPVGCKFCATGKLKKWRCLSYEEIFDQIDFVLKQNIQSPYESKELKILYTRMGEPFFMDDTVRCVSNEIKSIYPNAHQYISTIGLRDADYSWIRGKVTLQISLHSLQESRRDWLIPFHGKASLKELGEIRTDSWRKTTLNLALIQERDFNIETLKNHFNADYFFIKLSPINPNTTSKLNGVSIGVIHMENMI